MSCKCSKYDMDEGTDVGNKEEYVTVEVTITKANNEEIEQTEEFLIHYTEGQIEEGLWDKYTDRYGEIKDIRWKEV